MGTPINPEHLTREELEEEYSVRKIREGGSLGLNMLRKSFEDEASGLISPPSALENIRVPTHVRACKGILAELREAVQRFAKEADTSEEPIILSRYNNLVARLERLYVASGAHESVVELQLGLTEIGSFFDSARKSFGSADALTQDEQLDNTAGLASLHVSEQDGAGAAPPPPPASTTTQQTIVTDPILGSVQHASLPNSTNSWGNYDTVGSQGQTLGFSTLSSQARNIWGLPSSRSAGIQTSSLSFPRLSTGINTGATRKTQQKGSKANTNSRSYQQPENILLNDYSFPPSQVFIGNEYGNSWTTQPGASNTAYSLADEWFSRQQQHQDQTSFQQYPGNQSTTFRNQQNFSRPNLQGDGLPNKDFLYSQQPNGSAPRNGYPGQGIGRPNPPNQHQFRNQHRPANRPGSIHLMSKWSLKYRGTSSDLHVDDFLLRVETLANSLDIDLDRLAMGMPFVLEGEAQEWFWIFQREHPDADWETFRDEMRHQFSQEENQFEIWDKLRGRKQKTSETFGQFYIAVAAIAARLQPPLEEARMVELLRSNMSPGLKSALLYQRTATLRNLREAALKFEKLCSTTPDVLRETRGQPKRVSELAYGNFPRSGFSDQLYAHTTPVPDEYTQDDAIEAITKERSANRTEHMTCWNCEEVGHSFMDCTVATRNVFCYGCGAKNTYRPTCPRCKAGNFRQGVVPASNSRPNQPATPNRAPNPFAKQ